MPSKAASPCTAPGCQRLGTWRGRCETHKRDGRPTSAQRGYDRQWQIIRAGFVIDHLYCESVLHLGQRVPGADVDHIIPVAQGGTNASENLQRLCRSCHTIKTKSQTGGRAG